MPATRKQLERQLAEAKAARAALQPLLNETEGWDDVPESAIDEFVRGGGPRMLAAAGDQPRDENGRFASSEGGSGGGEKDRRVRDMKDAGGPQRWTKESDKARARVKAILTSIRLNEATDKERSSLKSNLARMTLADLHELRGEQKVFALSDAGKAKLAGGLHEIILARADRAAAKRVEEEKGRGTAKVSESDAAIEPAKVDAAANAAAKLGEGLATADWSQSEASRDSFLASVAHATEVYGNGARKLEKRYGPTMGRAIARAAMVGKAVGTLGTLAAEALTVGRLGSGGIGTAVAIELGGRTLDFPTPSDLVGSGFAAIAAAPLIGLARALEKVRGASLRPSRRPVMAADTSLSAGEIASAATAWLKEMDGQILEFMAAQNAFRESDSSMRRRAGAAAEIAAVGEPTDPPALATRMLPAVQAAGPGDWNRDEQGRFAAGEGGGGGAGSAGGLDANFDPAAVRSEVVANAKSVVPSIGNLPEKEMLEGLHRLSGAPSNWKSLVVSTSNGVRVDAFDPVSGGNCRRDIVREGDKTVCINRVVALPVKGTGLGTQMFASQVKELAAAGVSEIRCQASRDPGQNGYYTWARCGYDAPLPLDVRVHVGLFKMFKVDTVQKLMAMPGGKEIWKKHGRTLDMAFDLNPESTSRQALDRYLKEKGIKAAAAPDGGELFDYQAAGPEITESDDAALDEFWAEMGRKFAAEEEAANRSAE